MRLLNVNLRGLLIYSIVIVLISIPVSLFSIKAILDEEVDESISLQAEQFIVHIKSYEYLDDLETDLGVFDQLSYNIHIKHAENDKDIVRDFKNIYVYDRITKEEKKLCEL